MSFHIVIDDPFELFLSEFVFSGSLVGFLVVYQTPEHDGSSGSGREPMFDVITTMIPSPAEIDRFETTVFQTRITSPRDISRILK